LETSAPTIPKAHTTEYARPKQLACQPVEHVSSYSTRQQQGPRAKQTKQVIGCLKGDTKTNKRGFSTDQPYDMLKPATEY
jgi:hypothetical protein